MSAADRPTAPAFADVRSTAIFAAPDADAHAGDAVRSGAWRGGFVQNVLPFLTSLAFHAAVVLVGLLMYQAITVVAGPSRQEQVVLPDAELATTIAGIDDAHLGMSDQPDRPASQENDADVPPDTSAFSQERGFAQDLLAGGGEGTEVTDERTIAFARNGLGRGELVAFGNGNDGGVGRGRGGAPAPFGIPGGGVPSGSIFRGRHVVRSVAYVCDASGSMIDKFQPLCEQLHRSIATLKPIHSFNVIFFQEEQAAGLSKAGLLPALAENKRKAQQFLQDLHPTGPTDPIPALDLAFRQNPELIWLLTDGDFPDNEAVLSFIRQRNKGGKVRINTIAFVTRDEGYEKVLRTIAEENGGQFRFVAEEELD